MQDKDKVRLQPFIHIKLKSFRQNMFSLSWKQQFLTLQHM